MNKEDLLNKLATMRSPYQSLAQPLPVELPNPRLPEKKPAVSPRGRRGGVFRENLDAATKNVHKERARLGKRITWQAARALAYKWCLDMGWEPS